MIAHTGPYTTAGRLLTVLVCLASAGPVPAQGAADMPTEVVERYWVDPGPRDPGPVQSEPGAPKLLIVFPDPETRSIDLEEARYAGRVEPTTATVTLNGEPVTIYPGGLFSGLHEMPARGAKSRALWSFTATGADGRQTTVERIVERPEPAPTPEQWPVEFYVAPVQPTGDYWITRGQTLKVTLRASPGHRAEYRLEGRSRWHAMRRNGVRYTAELGPIPPDPGRPRMRTVYFRLIARTTAPGMPAKEKYFYHTSKLRVAVLPPDRLHVGRVNRDRATFLKHHAGWSRWGNWIENTPFPVLEIRGRRARTEFEHGEAGWIDISQMVFDWDAARLSFPELDAPELLIDRNELILSWPAAREPIAVVFHPERDAEGRALRRLRVSLPGAGSVPPLARRLDPGGPLRALHIDDSDGRHAPRIDVQLADELWGYDASWSPAEGFRLYMRTRPDRPLATPRQPLLGMRVLIDAGHGGRDQGAKAPSGLLEADLNLVQAAWLEVYLRQLGATTRQIRRDDRYVALDDRVAAAYAYNPDLFISLHHNSVPLSTDPLEHSGPIVFYHTEHSSPVARLIAERLHDVMPSRGGADETQGWTAAGVAGAAADMESDDGRGEAAGLEANGADEPRVKYAPFRVCRNISRCPSVLVETAFLSNPLDNGRLRQTDQVRRTAQAIALGIRRAWLGLPPRAEE